MSREISKIEKLQSIASKCKNLPLIESHIKNYQDSTKSAVENTLSMCRSVFDIYTKHKSKEISVFDLIYFCSTVEIEPKSPTFRKYKKIGECADMFEKYLDKLPSTFTVLHKITMLDPDLFEELINKSQINPSLSLDKLLEITNSKKVTAAKNTYFHFSVAINSKTISSESREYLINVFKRLYETDDIELIVPKKSSRYFNTKKLDK